MKKSIIVIIVIVLIAALAAGAGFYFYNKNKDDSEESKKNETSQAKEDKEDGEEKEEKKEKKGTSIEDVLGDLAKALASEDDLEAFLKDNLDFEAYAAMDKIDSEEALDGAENYEDYAKAYTDAFDEALEDLEEDDVDEDSILEESMETYADYVEEGLEVSEVGKEQECKIFPMFKKVEFTLVNEDEEESEYVALTHDGKLVIFIEASSYNQIESLLDTAF